MRVTSHRALTNGTTGRRPSSITQSRSVEGGRKTVDNAVLAHRLCNKLDHFIRNGLSIEKDLARVRKAREAAAGR